jgi:hypothetical protein
VRTAGPTWYCTLFYRTAQQNNIRTLLLRAAVISHLPDNSTLLIREIESREARESGCYEVLQYEPTTPVFSATLPDKDSGRVLLCNS